MATVAEVKLQGLRELAVLLIGQSAQHPDLVEMQDSYDEIYAALKVLSLATWVSTGPVPDEVVPHVVALVAMNRTITYPVSEARYQRIARIAAGAIPGIKALVNPPHESITDPDDF